MATPLEEKEEKQGGGQLTTFSTSGPLMVGAGTGEGGQGVAGGPAPKRAPFINPEDYLKQNVGAGRQLASRIGQTFGQPASQIKGQIGREGESFAQQAREGKVGFQDDLLTQTSSTPLGLTSDQLTQLGSRLKTQYGGPMKFDPSKGEILDPLSNLQERISAYVPGVDKSGRAQGILTEGARQQLVGEVMKPTSVGGKRALEELLLTAQPGALGTLGQQIGQAGSAVSRLQDERKRAEDIVKEQQEQARKTREQTEEAIRGGIGSLTGDVDERVAAEIEAGKERQELFKSLFDTDYTDEEKLLAERLGLRGEREDDQGEMTEFDTAAEIQKLLAGIQNPYDTEYGFLGEEYRGDEIEGVAEEEMVDPLSYFMMDDPSRLYTQESMITQEEADRMQALQDLIGGGTADIQRAENPLGADAISIHGNQDDLLALLTEQQAGMQSRAEQIRDDRLRAEAEAQIDIEFPDYGGSGPNQKPIPSFEQLNQNILELTNDIAELENTMQLQQGYETGVQDIVNEIGPKPGMSREEAAAAQAEMNQMLSEHAQEYANDGYDPDRFSMLDSYNLQGMKDKLEEYQDLQMDQISSQTGYGSDPLGISNMSDQEVQELQEFLNLDDDFMQGVIDSIYTPPVTPGTGTGTGGGGGGYNPPTVTVTNPDTGEQFTTTNPGANL